MQKLGSRAFKVTTDLFGNLFPQLVEQFGIDKELDLTLKFSDFRVTFWPEPAHNIMISFVTQFGLKEYQSMNYLIYDEFKTEAKLDIEITEETLIGNILDLTL